MPTIDKRKLFVINPKGTWPVWATFVLSAAVILTVIFFSLATPARDSRTFQVIFVGGAAVQFLAVLVFSLVFKRHASHFTTAAKAVVLTITTTFFWWGVAQPLFTIFVTNFNQPQLALMTLSWMWELPAFAGLVSGSFTLAIARPLSYLTNPRSLYDYTLRVPRLLGVGILFMVVLGYLIGAVILNIYANLPALEVGKLVILGAISAIFVGVFLYFAGDTLMRPIRKQLEKDFGIKPHIRKAYARRVFIITIIITVGSLLFIGIAILQSYQSLVQQTAEDVLSKRINQITTLNISPTSPAALKALKVTERTKVSIINESRLYRNNLYDTSTIQAINAHNNTSLIDRNGSEVMIGVFSPEGVSEKIVIEIPVSDYYYLITDGMRTYSIAALFVLVFATVITIYYSSAVSNTLRALSSAVRNAKNSLDPFEFNTYTADEMEDLSLAFRYYINQANDLRKSLEEKVQARTKALMEAEEEKRKLQEESARKTIQLEQQKREVAEDIAEKLEEKVQERTAALRDAVRHLQETDRVKSEFISLASHQLRTPLTGLKWAQQALLESNDTSESQERQAIIEKSLDRISFMTRLVNELLDVTRIEEEEESLNLVAVQTTELLNNIISGQKDHARRQGISLVPMIVKDLPVIQADPDKLTMAIDNLVDNAIKYTPSGGKVLLKAVVENDSIVITVQDTGVGIPKKDQYRVFSKFFRTESAVAMQTSGSGLGMYITKIIIERHGGEVALESKENVGTKITCTLPLPNKKKASGPKHEEGDLGAISSLVDEE